MTPAAFRPAAFRPAAARMTNNHEDIRLLKWPMPNKPTETWKTYMSSRPVDILEYTYTINNTKSYNLYFR